MATAYSTKKSMEVCREQGWPVWKVEQYNPHARKKYDMFGFADIVTVQPEHAPQGILAIQACGDDVAEHIRKVTEDPEIMPYLRTWLVAGGRFELWAWRRRKFRLKNRKWSNSKRWRLTRWVFEAAPGGVYYEEVTESLPVSGTTAGSHPRSEPA